MRELAHNGGIARISDADARRFADQIEPEVLELRRAAGLADGGNATFWRSANRGETPLWTIRPRDSPTTTLLTTPPPEPAPEPTPSRPPAAPQPVAPADRGTGAS